MRSIILGVMFLLAGCNGSTAPADNDSAYATKAELPPNEATAIAAMRAEIADAQATVSELKASVSKLQLIGQVHGTPAKAARTAGLGNNNFLPNSVNFGPCTDMGVLIGRGGRDSNIPLASALESFQTCTGYSYTVSTLDGTIQGPPFAGWDGPNCTGNLLIITDIPGNGFNPQVINNGVVFTGPVDNVVYMVAAGSIPTLMSIQSSMNLGPGGGVCDTDIESRLAVQSVPNDVSITGVQSAPIPLPITIAAP